MKEEEVLELFPDSNINQILTAGHGFGEYSLLKNLKVLFQIIFLEK